jgi:hypothetical protein
MLADPRPADPEYQQQVIEFLTERCGGPPKCPMCGKQDWRVSDPVALPLTTFPFPERVEWGNVGNNASLICNNCLFMALFAWKMKKAE